MLKFEIEKEVTLSYPDYSQGANKLELFVDASGIGAGACLTQLQKDENITIGYASMAFSATQRNYPTIERELAAVRWGIQAFRAFVAGISFIFHTDHKPLIYMHNLAPFNSKMQSTMNELKEFDFEIRYIPGVLNFAADYLSRVNIDIPDDQNEKEGLPETMEVVQKIEGGGDSMFLAMMVLLREVFTVSELPTDHLELRKQTINELLNNRERYKILKTKEEKNM